MPGRGRRPAPVDIGISGGRIAAIAPRLAAEAAEIDVGGRLVLPGFVDTHIHLDKACLLGRCGHDHGSVSEAIARGRRDEARFHGRGHLCARREGDRARDRARHHADANPCRDRSAHRLAGLRGDQGAEARLCLGDRSVDVRVPAGGPDQRSRRRGTSGRGAARRRRGDRRLSLYGHRSATRISNEFSTSRRNSTSTSTCISISTSIRPGGISTRSAGRPSGATTRAASPSATPQNCRRCRRQRCRRPPSGSRNPASPSRCFPRPTSI